MKVLVTGGAGFIGSHIVERYQGRAEEIRVLDNLRTGCRENLGGLDCRFIEGSIANRDLLALAMTGVDYVFHLAALVGVPESLTRPEECIDINVRGLLNTLEAASAAGVKKLVFASSASVYGDGPEETKIETLLPRPQSPYAITKLDGEYYLDLFRRERGLETVAIRLFNVFGPRQNPEGAYAAAVPAFVGKALKGQDIIVHGDGEQTRDFIYVRDIADAFAFAAGSPGLFGVFNAGCGGMTTINGLASKIVAAAGSTSKIIRTAKRPGDVRHSRAGTDKLRSAGWQAACSINEALAITIESYRARP